MSDTPPLKLKEFARQLLAYEVASRKPGAAKDSAAFHVCEKLRGPLVRLLGVGGLRALFSRALALANTDVAWLRALHIKADGSLEGLDELEAKLDRDAIARGEVALVAQLLGLLVTFIGQALTLGLIRETWPKAAFDDLSFENANRHEKKQNPGPDFAAAGESAAEGANPQAADGRARPR